MRPTKTLAERFWSKVVKGDGCWEWTGATAKNGTTFLGVPVNGKWTVVRASRIAWELTYGSITKDDVVFHTCSNPGCVNPSHLRVEKQAVNWVERFWDKVRKGDGCWIWTGAKENSRGIFHVPGSKGRTEKAHRVAWELCRSPVPEGFVLRRVCGNSGCVNPDHMRLFQVFDNLLERFWDNVRITSTCWLWTGSHNEFGYGQMAGRVNGNRTMILAHRYSWELHNHCPIPNDLCVLHKCDIPACVNPKHLWLGTRIDNNRDMTAKGREYHGDKRGEKNPLAKLTDDKVRLMRSAYGDGWEPPEIALSVGVDLSVIHRVLKQKAWSHVE
jgi:hypothetical protein